MMSERADGTESGGQLSAISRNNWHVIKVSLVAGY